jgi:hypothetical protein
MTLLPSAAQAANSGLAFFDGSVYELVETELNWESASAAANAMAASGCGSAHLATINSPNEQAVLSALVADSPGRAWLGGLQPPDELSLDKGWQWITGEPWVYTNWDDGEPNDNPHGTPTPGSEQHLVILPEDGAWNDAPGVEAKLFVVESEECEEVGLVDTSQGVWHLRNSTGVVTTFGYGNPGDLPISGDWDGDGTSTPGLYRQSDGFFYSRNSNSTGIADAECFAGDPADIPVSGDWDGDGDDNLGIYRPSQQMFYLFTTTCTGSPMGAAQISFLFGNPGDNPVAGDWDGDGIDEVGLHRESTGFFYWRNTLDTGIASDEIFFGDPGDRFVSGDWGIVDGVDTPAIFRPSDLTFYFRHTLTQGNADSQFTWTGAGPQWLPVAGDFGLG